MKVRFDPRFPHPRGWPRIALAVSIVVHVLLFLGPVESRLPVLTPPRERVVVLQPPLPEPAQQPRFTFVVPEPTRNDPVPESRATVGRARAREPAPPAAFVPLVPRLRPPPVDTGTPSPRRPGFARIAPEFGNGVLWVRPVPVSPEALARRLEEEHVEHVDSAVSAIMQAFLDSLAQEPGAVQKLPDWTTQVAGSKFGLDSRFIYIAGLKIPAAVLALLPLPQGNIDQARAYNHLMDLRADIERAARRAENMDEFKRVIREIRERKQRDRDLNRAQRETPPPPPQDPPTP